MPIGYSIDALRSNPRTAACDWDAVDGLATGFLGQPGKKDGVITLEELRKAEWDGLLGGLSDDDVFFLKTGLAFPWGPADVERTGTDSVIANLGVALGLVKELKTFVWWDVVGTNLARVLGVGCLPKEGDAAGNGVPPAVVGATRPASGSTTGASLG